MITTSTAVLLTVLGNQPKQPPVSTPTHEITYMTTLINGVNMLLKEIRIGTFNSVFKEK